MAEEDKGNKVNRDRDGETPKGAHVEAVRVEGDMLPLEEKSDHPEFIPERTNLLLQGVYGDFPNHNNGSHLDRGVTDNALR